MAANKAMLQPALAHETRHRVRHATRASLQSINGRSELSISPPNNSGGLQAKPLVPLTSRRQT
jgi:hypothetical protein